MKKLMLCLGLGLLAVACRASGATVHDTSCTGPDCTDCTKEQMEDCGDCTGAKAECSAEAKAECSGEGQVCPVTGKTMN